MCCVWCGKRLDHRPRLSFVEGWEKYEGKSPSSLSKMQFDEIRQNNGRIYDFIPVGVRGVDTLFGETINPIPQPEDRGILLKDIIEDDVDEKYYLTDEVVGNLIEHKRRHKALGNGFGAKFHEEEDKMAALKVGGRGVDDLICCAMRGRGENNEQQLEPQPSGKSNSLTSVQKDNLLVIPEATAKGYVEIEPGECFDAENINSKTRRGRKMVNKSNCLMAKETDFMRYEAVGCDYRSDEGFRFRDNGKSGTLQARARNDESCGQLASIGTRIRRLTPLEAERLQTMKDNFTAVVSDSQRYKIIGNGWTIDVIAHIFKYIT